MTKYLVALALVLANGMAHAEVSQSSVPVCGSTNDIKTDDIWWEYVPRRTFANMPPSFSELWYWGLSDEEIDCDPNRIFGDRFIKWVKVPYEISWRDIPGTNIRLGLKKDHSVVWELNSSTAPLFPPITPNGGQGGWPLFQVPATIPAGHLNDVDDGRKKQ